jgi:hypothetical protein
MPGHDENGVLISGPGVPCAFPELGVRSPQDRCAKGERCCVTFPADRGAPPDAKVEAVCQAWSKKTDQEGLSCSGWTLLCDEASDCGAGEVCCGWGGDNPLHAECRKASDCKGTMLCVPGGSCPDNLLCIGPWLSWAETHRCVAPTKTAIPCGSKGICPAERPFCRWDEAKRTGTCVERKPSDAPREGSDVFECFSRSDCGIGGQRCCGSSSRSACNGDCGTHFPGSDVLCKSDAECEQGKRCVSAASGPPSLRRCE